MNTTNKTNLVASLLLLLSAAVIIIPIKIVKSDSTFTPFIWAIIFIGLSFLFPLLRIFLQKIFGGKQ